MALVFEGRDDVPPLEILEFVLLSEEIGGVHAAGGVVIHRPEIEAEARRVAGGAGRQLQEAGRLPLFGQGGDLEVCLSRIEEVLEC